MMMNRHLHLDPSSGELLTSAWRELDAKFLSNDTLTVGQRNLQPVSPADRLDHILSHSSLYIRASDLVLYLENVGDYHLKQHFQLIVEAIFGYNTKYPGWSLRAINKASNPREAAVILRLLGATGSLLSLATRLLEDPGLFVEVGLEKLPFVLSQRILQGDVPPYFRSRLCPTDPYPATAISHPMIKCLKVNTFEFFFMSFAAHICSLKGVGNSGDYLVGWGTMVDNLYNNLLDDYLGYFFPCNGHGVPCDNFRLTYQQVNDSMYIAQSLRSHMIHADASANNHEGTSPRLLKSSLLLDNSNTSHSRGESFFPTTLIQKEVWRTETILLICTELWMSHTSGMPSYKNSSSSPLDQFGKTMLPTVDVVKSIRNLVRHSHFFLNCISSTVTHPMEELKRDVYPTYQKRLYKFLRHLFCNWPLDNSFRIVYETWLSHVQPWRYVYFERIRAPVKPDANSDGPVDTRWYPFIQENILFYTKLLSLMLTRMSRVDFATTKNAQMFYRVSKVFTSHEYLKMMLLDIDNTLLSYEQPYSGQLNGMPSRSPSSPGFPSSPYMRYGHGDNQRGNSMIRIASLRQTIKEWEFLDYIYEPLFSENNKKLMITLIESTRVAKNQLQEVIDATIQQQGRNQSWWDKMLGSNKQYNAVVGQSINELNRAITQLDVSEKQFASFFNIVVMEERESMRPVFNPTRLPRSPFVGNSLEGSALEGSENRITVLPSGTFTSDMLVPIGNPDYVGARSDECAILVRWTREFSANLNVKFAGDIMRLYFQKSWKGRLARATFSEPMEYFDIEKKGRVREKTRKVLPPRINLRFLSSINFLLLIVAFFIVFMMFGLTLGVFPGFFFCWLIFVFIRAISEPETKLDDMIYLFGDRNYNVDFRGQNEHQNNTHQFVEG